MMAAACGLAMHAAAGPAAAVEGTSAEPAPAIAFPAPQPVPAPLPGDPSIFMYDFASDIPSNLRIKEYWSVITQSRTKIWQGIAQQVRARGGGGQGVRGGGRRASRRSPCGACAGCGSVLLAVHTAFGLCLPGVRSPAEGRDPHEALHADVGPVGRWGPGWGKGARDRGVRVGGGMRSTLALTPHPLPLPLPVPANSNSGIIPGRQQGRDGQVAVRQPAAPLALSPPLLPLADSPSHP